MMRSISDRCGQEWFVAAEIMRWFDGQSPQTHIKIEPYMAAHSLIVRVGWSWGGYGFARVDASVDPPEFVKWTSGHAEDSRLDLTLPNFWRAFTLEPGGDRHGTFQGLCPPGPRQLEQRKQDEAMWATWRRESEARGRAYQRREMVRRLSGWTNKLRGKHG